jgi:hypothetical protein
MKLNYQGLLGGVKNTMQFESSSSTSSKMCVHSKVSQTIFSAQLICLLVKHVLMITINVNQGAL